MLWRLLKEELFGRPVPTEAGRDIAGSTRKRDMAAQSIFMQFPGFVYELEKGLFFGVLVLFDAILATLMLPLKLLVPHRINRFDVVRALLVAGGTWAFMVPAETKLYSTCYHFIRTSSMLKLYVIFNMLEVIEKLLSSMVSDLCDSLWFSLRPKQQRDAGSWLFAGLMFALAALGVAAHSLVLLLHVITINVAVNSDGNSLFTLLISNNFLEVKGQVFKKATPEALFQGVLSDAIERVQYIVFMIVMLGQHAQSAGFGTVEPREVLLIFGCEICIDNLKHWYWCRFNHVSHGVYRYFSQSVLLDVARDKFLSRIHVPIYVPATSVTVLNKSGILRQKAVVDRDAPKLAYAGSTLRGTQEESFVPEPARRAGFAPYAYVALLIFEFLPVVAKTGWLTILLGILCAVVAKTLVTSIISGASLRLASRKFLVSRDVLAELYNNPPSDSQSQAGSSNLPTPVPGMGAPLAQGSQQDKLTSLWARRGPVGKAGSPQQPDDPEVQKIFGVSPQAVAIGSSLLSPSLGPTLSSTFKQRKNSAQEEQSLARSDDGRGSSSKPRGQSNEGSPPAESSQASMRHLCLLLDSTLVSLMCIVRNDNQSGKAK